MTTTAAPVMIRLFGEPEICVDGEPLVFANQKARALLYYLAATGQAHTRSHLATLLWSESPTENARRSLRATLFQLRRVLQTANLGHALAGAGDLLRLDLADDACDVADFRRLVAAGSESALIEAIDLVRGPLLAGFALPNTPLFDEWLRLEDQKLTQMYLGALEQLAGAAGARQSWNQALSLLQRLVQADPLAEEAQQQLIGLYLKTGAVGLALRQFHQFEAELRDKLGLAPAPATQALFQEALRLHQAAPAPKSRRAPRLSGRTQPALPFVGRDLLLDRLLAIAQDVKAGQSCTVLVQGDGGIGKTRLLSEFLTRLAAEQPSWLMLQGACSPFDDLLSYGPFLEAFQEGALGDNTDRQPALNPDAAAPNQFAHHILQTLRRLGQSAPLVLAVDDLQWANSSTLTLFGLLATRLHHLPLMLIGAAQRPETIPALQRLITVERRRGKLQLLSLPPLTEAAIADLLRDMGIDTASVHSLAAWLQERSDGNPFVLDEIVAQLRADAILTGSADRWQLDPGRWLRWRAAYTLPETTHDLVSWRLRNLKADAHAPLEILSVAGQPLPIELLSDVSGVQVELLLPIIDDLLTRRLLIETANNTFALPHYLLRETVLQRLSHVRRRMVHRRLAHALAKCPALLANLSPWEVARQAVAGEDVELARRYGLPMLSRLPQDYTGAVTVDFLHHLYDLLAPSAVTDEMIELTRALGDVHQSLGRVSEAARWRQQYLDLAYTTGDAAVQAFGYLEQSDLALVSNDYVAATAAAVAGLAACALLASTDPAVRRLLGRGHRLLGHALAMEGSDLALAERHLQEATAAHRLAEDPHDLCASLFELGNVAAQRGQLLPALEFYEEAAQVAEIGQNHYMHALARNNLAYHSLLLGWLKAAQRALAHGQRLAEAHELLGALLHLSSTQGEIHLYSAEWDEARHAFQRGLALAEELGNLERQAGYRAGLALAARGQHDLGGATSLLEEALLLISGRGYWHLRARLQIWLAETLLEAEQVAAAWPHLNAALETARLHGRALLQLQADRLHARLLAAGGDWPAAEACFTQAAAAAATLDIPLEIARTQAAWGLAAIQSGSAPHQGEALLSQARLIFADHQAIAELDLLGLRNNAENNESLTPVRL